MGTLTPQLLEIRNQDIVDATFSESINDTMQVWNSTLRGCTFESMFRRGAASSFTVVSSSFHSCRFVDLDVDCFSFGAGLTASIYNNCVFSNCKIRSRVVGGATFVNCRFQNCKILEFIALSAEFVDCEFSSTLSGVIFSAKSFPDPRHIAALGRDTNRFTGNDFSNARLENVSFRGGINICAQRFASTPETLVLHDLPACVSALHRAASECPDQKIRKQFVALAGMYESEIHTGQTQAVLWTHGFARRYPDAVNLLREIARHQVPKAWSA